MDTHLFEKAPVPKAYFSMALPVVLSMLVTLVYNTVDTFFIAHTGNASMVAGVSLAAPVFTMMIALGDIFGLGGSSIISRLFGQHRFHDGKRVSLYCFYGSIALGLVMIIIGLTLQSPILRLLGVSSATGEYARQYYWWIIIGSPFIIFSIVPSNLLRAEGFVIPSMIGQLAGTVINIGLNPLFISVFGWGAAGSAMATVLSNVISSAYYVWFLVRRSCNLSINPRLLVEHVALEPVSTRDATGAAGAREEPQTTQTTVSQPSPASDRGQQPPSSIGREMVNVFIIGVPSSITNIMQSLGIILVNHYLLAYGDDAVAAMGIALKLTMIAVLILVGFSFGAQPLIGYNYGAGNMRRLRDILRFAFLFEMGLALAMSLLLALPAEQLMTLFIKNPLIIREGAGMPRMQMLTTVFVAVIMLVTVIFQSTGKALGAFLLSAGRQGYFLWLGLVVMSRAFGYQGVIAGQPVADVLTAVLAVVLFAVMLPAVVRPSAADATTDVVVGRQTRHTGANNEGTEAD